MDKNRILITGGNGQLGMELRKLITDNAIFTNSSILDITDFNAVQSFVKDNAIDTIINCAAYTNVDKAEDEEEIAYKVNSVGPENLSKLGCKLVHISTDYVFDGFSNKAYKVNDMTNPLSVYGKSKLAGEIAVLNNCDSAIVIRTSWLYSLNGKNFLKTMLNLGKEKDYINVVDDQIGTPTFAEDLAKVIVDILPKVNNETRGIYHFSNEGVCSWYDFAYEIMKYAKLNCNVIPIPTSSYPTKAIRPVFSVLDKSEIKEVFDIKIRHWSSALERCLSKNEFILRGNK